MNNDSGKWVIFIILSAAILFGYNAFFMPKAAPKVDQGVSSQPAKASGVEPAKPGAVKTPNQEAALLTPGGSVLMINSSILNVKENTYILENNLFKATFSNVGGTLKSFTLKKYFDTKGSRNLVEVITDGFTGKGFSMKNGPGNEAKPSMLELIPSNSAYTYLSLSSPDSNIGQSEWQATAATKNSVTFTKQLKPGVSAVKIFTIADDSYVLDTRIKIVNNTSAPAAVKDLQYTWGPNIHFLPEDLLKSKSGVRGAYNRVAYQSMKAFKSTDMNIKAKETKITILDVVPDWIVMKDLYFGSSFIINKKDDVKSVAVKQAQGGFAYMTLNLRDILVNANSEEAIEIPSYIGAAEYKNMKKYGMEQAVDLGSIRFLGVWMFYALDFAYQLTKNWGLAILLITIIIRLALWIPSQSSFKHMKDTQAKMNIIKPRLETLKKIYKDDPQKQNEEMMKLYQEYKINPFGGCLPLLLQIPIFIALYATLINMVELKGASFALWWTDLSQPDPFLVLPLFMGVTMLLQQKMSQTAPTMDSSSEMSQKMLLYGMPIMLTVMSFQWPAGLMLYWGISNVLGILQQLLVNKSK